MTPEEVKEYQQMTAAQKQHWGERMTALAILAGLAAAVVMALGIRARFT